MRWKCINTRPARCGSVCPGSLCEQEVGQLLAGAARFLDGILRIGGSDCEKLFDPSVRFCIEEARQVLSSDLQRQHASEFDEGV